MSDAAAEMALVGAAVSQLERCLPVLNGITYTNDAARLFVLRSGALPQLLVVFAMGAQHFELQEYALRVLVNITFSKEQEVQRLAAQQGALDALLGLMLAVPQPHCSTEGCGDGDRGEGALKLCLDVLCDLATGCDANARAIASSTEVCQKLLALCDAALPEDLRIAAAELLLALLGAYEVRISLMQLGATRRLEQLACWRGTNTTLAFKAAQALKEHVAEASGSLCS